MGFLLWDDDVNIYENPFFEKDPLGQVDVFWTNWKGGYENLWIPLTYTVWAALADVAAFPPGVYDDKSGDVAKAAFEPAVFHGFNLLLHLAAVLLVFGILRHLSAGDKRPEEPGPEAPVWPAAMGAALFAAHPMMVEPVAWVTGMKDLLAGTLMLAATWAYLRHADRDAARPAEEERGVRSLVVNAGVSLATLAVLTVLLMTEVFSASVFSGCVLAWFAAETMRRERRSAWYALCAAAYLLALLAKPSAVVFPVMALLLGVGLKRRPWVRAGFEVYPWFGVAAILTVFTWLAQSGGNFRYEPPPVWFRPVVALDALYFYLVKIVFPVGLGPDYGRSPEWLMGQGQKFFTWLLPCAVAFFAARAWIVKDKRIYAVGLAIFVVALSPMLGLVPSAFLGVSAVADRYAYVALLGVAIIAARILADHWGEKWVRWAGAGAIALCCGLTMRQAPFWKDSDTLFARTLEVNPRSWLMLYNMGTIATARENYDEALTLYERAVELLPWYADAYSNMGTEYARRGDLDKGLEYWRKAIHHQEGHFQALHNLAINLIKDGRFEEALEELQRSFREMPYIKTRDLIAQAYHENAARLFNEKRFGESVEYFIEAITIVDNPIWRNDLAHAYNNQGVMLLAEGKESESIPYFQKAVELDDVNITAKSNLAYSLVNSGRSEEAVQVFRAYLPLFENDPMYVLSYGVACGDQGMRKESLELIDRALRMNDALPVPDAGFRRRALEFREKFGKGE